MQLKDIFLLAYDLFSGGIDAVQSRLDDMSQRFKDSYQNSYGVDENGKLYSSRSGERGVNWGLVSCFVLSLCFWGGSMIAIYQLTQPYQSNSSSLSAITSSLNYKDSESRAISYQAHLLTHPTKRSSIENELIDLRMEHQLDLESWDFVDVPPIPINTRYVKRKIGYPAFCEKTGIKGTVIARVLVNKKGEYVKHKIIHSAHPLLERVVDKNAHLLDFVPAIHEGKAVHLWVNVPFHF